MRKIAMIKNNVVENISSWCMQTPWNPGAEWTLYDVTNLDDIVKGDVFDPVEKKIVDKNIQLVDEITLVDGLPG